MKNKSYYLDLAERWFDALLTGDEERELKAFLAGTDDPDFDEVKAVAGFFATGKAVATEKVSIDTHISPVSVRFRWIATVAVAVSLAFVAAIGLRHRQNDCYILTYGEKLTDSQAALADMTATLADLFEEGEDVGVELSDLFNPVL